MRTTELECLSDRRLELGLVPLGSIGLSVFTADLFVASLPCLFLPPTTELAGLSTFLARPNAVRIVVDLILVALFSGLYTVPLFIIW